MKKLAIIFVVITLFTLSACSGNKNRLYDIEREMYIYESVKCATEKDKYSAEDTVIRYTMTNISDKEAWINSDDNCFELQKQVDGKWKRVGTKVDQIWTDLAQLLPSNESEKREINLHEYFYLPLEKGEHRIVVEDIVSNTFDIF